MKRTDEPYGMLAEFDSAERLVAATRAAANAGYAQLEAYAPIPVEALHDVLPAPPRRVAPFMLLGGLLAGGVTYFVQFYSAVIDYPINVGGRPLDSWPAFVPPAVEMTVLGAAFAGIIAALALDGLPRFHHPLFDVARFERASCDGFFLCVRASDPRFDPGATRRFLEGLHPIEVNEVGA